MPRYLIQGPPAAQQWAAVIQNPHSRKEALRPLFESFGGKLDEYYVAFGEGTVHLLAEMPDQESIDAAIAAIRASGALTSVSVTAILTAEEAIQVMKKAGEVAYRPPTG